ncbi:hypothetical protein SMSP2_02948 [Limihaloglobus sulfuriphilus]|uniref:Dockerin domain-containing protein n=2 Tax=Limihaloglobus sulfuriphilus TaxID=1851148 RepID=A0A1Q2MIZ8_9BACT|nr:hypothetical protein SMSP2_02948 [Limihaloglobus sulfuriphilus]
MDEIAVTVNNLNPDVRVVTSDEFIEQIYINLSPCGTAPAKADINNDCKVNLEDFSIFSQQWLKISSSSADIRQDGLIDQKDLNDFSLQWLE